MSHAHEFRQLEGALANLDDLIGSMTKDAPTAAPAPTDEVDLDALIADLNRSFPMAGQTAEQPTAASNNSPTDDGNDYEHLGKIEPYPDYDQLEGDAEAFKEELGDDIGVLKPNKAPLGRGPPPMPFKRSASLPTPHLFKDGRSFEETRERTLTPPPPPNIPVPLPPREPPPPFQDLAQPPGHLGQEPLTPPPMPPELIRSRTTSHERKMSLPEDEREWRKQLLKQTSENISSESKRKVLVNFHNIDQSYKTLALEETYKARDICNRLVIKNMGLDDKNWMLIEFLSQFKIQRVIEDHELVLSIYDSWGGNMDNIIYFKNDFKKYEIFQNPAQFFPTHMIEQSEEDGALSEKAEKAKKILLQNLFSTTDRVPDIESYLHLKEQGRRSWKRAFCMLRGTRIVYSSKGTSKDPKHLVTFTIFDDLDLYLARTPKETFGAPTDFCFCFKPRKPVRDARELICLCTDDPRSLKCWMAGVRLGKYSGTLRENYRIAVRRMEKLKKLKQDNDKDSDSLISGPYSDQLWYHGLITREETSRRMAKHGFNDGAFMVRDSQSSPGSFVISFILDRKIKHFQVLPMKVEGETFYSVDEGRTKFYDVTDLVNYYTKERGIMPVLLKEIVRRD
ncbi:growth factor receptor-bound protein 14-like [Lineus longissimus]|uniref:growth factor receptor-bound protein 14-like n=1 Tax=Lineus longissimus TaxID=88925 RepID=UPI002B4F4F94